VTTTELPGTRPPETSGARLVEWVVTVDHKKIGLLYLGASLVFFAAGGVLAMLIRAELAAPGLQFGLFAGLYSWFPKMFGRMLAVAGLLFLYNVVVSLARGELAGDDPWQANSLEWVTTSPPPAHNFHQLPEIHSERPVYDLRRGLEHPETGAHTDPQTKPDRG
jgi:heme/copper-type cytochrome/quinol oxidase subunit 1